MSQRGRLESEEGDCGQLWTYLHAVTVIDSLCESEASVVTASTVVSISVHVSAD